MGHCIPIIILKINRPMITHIFNQIQNYITALDWSYILTFIIITYGINKIDGKDLFPFSFSTKWKVLIIGVLYGVVIYMVRDYTIRHIEILFKSFVFALVFHKFILQGLIRFLENRFTKKDIQSNENKST